MIFGSGPSLWIVLLFLGMLVVVPVSSVKAIHFLISGNFSKTALIMSAALYLLFVIFKVSNGFDSTGVNLVFLGMPYSFVVVFFSAAESALIFFGLIGLVLNYLALFSIVNIIYRKFLGTNL